MRNNDDLGMKLIAFISISRSRIHGLKIHVDGEFSHDPKNRTSSFYLDLLTGDGKTTSFNCVYSPQKIRPNLVKIRYVKNSLWEDGKYIDRWFFICQRLSRMMNRKVDRYLRENSEHLKKCEPHGPKMPSFLWEIDNPRWTAQFQAARAKKKETE